MIPVAALLLQAAAAPPPAAASPTVVVIGHRLEHAQTALAACLARACPPREDIAAATALAVAQFLAGRYDDARRTAGRAVDRDQRYVRVLPVEVSDLMALHGAMALLTGYADTGRIRTIAAVSALEKGQLSDDERAGFARIAVADVFARQGMFPDAVEMYDIIRRHAAALGQRQVEGRAMFGAAMLYATAASLNPAYGGEARRRIATLAATTDPALQPYRDATVALRGRLAAGKGHRRELARVLAEAATIRSHEALLVYDPPLDVAGLLGEGAVADPVEGDTDGQWLTVAFRIAPDGTVRDAAVQEAGAHASPRWRAAVERAVAQRRYLPLDLPADSPGLVRLERVSLVRDKLVRTGSHIRSAAGPIRAQWNDLTSETAATSP